MPKKLVFTKEDYFRMLDQKLAVEPPQSNYVISKLKMAAQQLRARFGGTTRP